MAQGPTNQLLEDALSQILGTADLNTISLKDVRFALEGRFKCDLSERKQFIMETTTRLCASPRGRTPKGKSRDSKGKRRDSVDGGQGSF